MSESRANELGLPPASPDQQYLSQGPLGPISLRSVIDPSLTSVPGTGANQLLKAKIAQAESIALGFGPGTIGAWHGTGAAPFARFSDEFIGTGEGAQAYGMGHYVAGSRRVAESYMPEEGSLLQVNVKPEHEEFMDWDLPFEKQEPGVQDKIRGIASQFGWHPIDLKNMKGSDIYSEIANSIYSREADAIQQQFGIGTHVAQMHLDAAARESDTRASAMLHEAGVPGNRYTDQLSRRATAVVDTWEKALAEDNRAVEAAQPGTADWLIKQRIRDTTLNTLNEVQKRAANPTYNYVVFHPDNIEIKTRDGIPLEPVDHDPFK